MIAKNGKKEQIPAQALVLAIGHSARDTFTMLKNRRIAMEQKPFSVGVRIEHLRAAIDRAQYGLSAGTGRLGAADYKLATHLPNGRGVYTFCMCPGGFVVAAASEESGVVTNGMSHFARNAINSNSALLVGVGPSDFQSSDVLAGVYYQRRLRFFAKTFLFLLWKHFAKLSPRHAICRSAHAFSGIYCAIACRRALCNAEQTGRLCRRRRAFNRR